MSKARDLANIISGSGTLNANVIPNLSASKITSGTLGADRVPALPTSKITSGTFDDARLSASSVTQHVDLSNLNASNLTSGTVPSARVSLSASDIPSLDTAKITTGTFADARLSSSSVTQHVDLTSLSADNLTSGTVPSARLSLSASDIPNLSASKITSGTMDGSRISGGTFGSVNGSALTSLPSSAPTNSQILSGVASASVGAVGSYAAVYMNSTRSPGTTFSGNHGDYKYGSRGTTVLPSGTWRVMGQTNANIDAQRNSVVLRIS